LPLSITLAGTGNTVIDHHPMKGKIQLADQMLNATNTRISSGDWQDKLWTGTLGCSNVVE
jgi:hypothetical protein